MDFLTYGVMPHPRSIHRSVWGTHKCGSMGQAMDSDMVVWWCGGVPAMLGVRSTYADVDSFADGGLAAVQMDQHGACRRVSGETTQSFRQKPITYLE